MNKNFVYNRHVTYKIGLIILCRYRLEKSFTYKVKKELADSFKILVKYIIALKIKIGWLVGCKFNSSCHTRKNRWNALHGGISKGSYPVFKRVSEKTTGNSKRLGREARPEIEPGTSRQPVLCVELLRHWWGLEN